MYVMNLLIRQYLVPQTAMDPNGRSGSGWTEMQFPSLILFIATLWGGVILAAAGVREPDSYTIFSIGDTMDDKIDIGCGNQDLDPQTKSPSLISLIPVFSPPVFSSSNSLPLLIGCVYAKYLIDTLQPCDYHEISQAMDMLDAKCGSIKSAWLFHNGLHKAYGFGLDGSNWCSTIWGHLSNGTTNGTTPTDAGPGPDAQVAKNITVTFQVGPAEKIQQNATTTTATTSASNST
ncbi:hypothetical protein QBC46DRAFT_412265 [Diplogelasinospora grovesii]|uniref:Uncharacterized protein n=1 Tax=Diplogelasinospora grovesii TaxID=303347 RepID=A0AAN6MZG6_9PEZI|nr:hypothetical protein QBC46DRAFT_412265 [Diplogelasinospora grovesii]